MSEKKEIEKKYKQKVKDLKNHNKYYYGKDNPKISDAAYDKLKQEIFSLKKKYFYLKKLNITNNI